MVAKALGGLAAARPPLNQAWGACSASACKHRTGDRSARQRRKPPQRRRLRCRPPSPATPRSANAAGAGTPVKLRRMWVNVLSPPDQSCRKRGGYWPGPSVAASSPTVSRWSVSRCSGNHKPSKPPLATSTLDTDTAERLHPSLSGQSAARRSARASTFCRMLRNARTRSTPRASMR